MKRGERNDDVWKFILSNVRQPDHMAGDLHAQMASGEVGAQRLAALCDRHGLDDIEDLADEIIERSEDATRDGIRELASRHATSPRRSLDLADGSEIDIVCALIVDADAGEITVDYNGSADASRVGHQRRQELHARLHHLHGAVGAQPRHPEQPRQPRPRSR